MPQGCDESDPNVHPVGADDCGFFQRITLADIGLRIQLGHRPGDPCPKATHYNNFTVIDINGIHEVNINFCNCLEGSRDHGIQIRRFGWYPATVRAPKSAATIRVLKLFQLLAFESKMSTQEFYKAIERCTHNIGVVEIKVHFNVHVPRIYEERSL